MGKLKRIDNTGDQQTNKMHILLKNLNLEYIIFLVISISCPYTARSNCHDKFLHWSAVMS